MNRNSLSKALFALCSGQLTLGVSNDVPKKYQRVFENTYDGKVMGIDEDGYWCVVHDNKIWSPKTVGDFYVFYTLLYSELNTVIRDIRKGLMENGLPEKFVYSFPFDDLMLSAINSSSHWKNLCLKWVNQGYPLNDEAILALCGGDKQSRLWLDRVDERLKNVIEI